MSGIVSAGPVTLWSVGHSTLALDDFLALLAEHEIARAVDVRRHPWSRRHPHFARESLALALPRAGVHYVHLVDLGGHRESAGSMHVALPPGAFQGYAEHMSTPAFGAALAHLVQLARERRTAFLCAEARFEDCHRRLLSDALVARGARVRHVRRDAAPIAHLLHAGARIADGRLVYDRTPQGELFGPCGG